MTVEVLRSNKKPELNVTCDRDHCRGVESAPCFFVFRGAEINDHYLTLAERRAVRGREA